MYCYNLNQVEMPPETGVGEDETLTKTQKKQQQRFERLQKAKKALQGISPSSTVAGAGAGDVGAV